jgi:thioredoxin reductase (NADPH)
MTADAFDCLIVGGGPAGLTAAIYLARYRRHVVVLDAGNSRAAVIPRTKNYPGFAHGISGKDLLASLGAQAAHYKIAIIPAEVEGLARHSETFRAVTSAGTFFAPRVVLATGLVDKRPEITDLDPDRDGDLVRYCPVCDGFEATDKDICVFGTLKDASTKALFLRTFSSSVSLLTPESTSDSAATKDLIDAGVRTYCGPAQLRQENDKITAILHNGSKLVFDILYPVLGCLVRSNLATSLGALTADVGTLIVDEHLRTTVPNLYAVGDVVSDLHQIAVGTGHAAIAATHIHNSLPRNFR